MNGFGMDVSHWQGKIDWLQAKQAGIQFAFIKATQATTWMDACFYRNVEGARGVNIAYGPYHYYTAAQDPIQQAGHFCAVACAQGDLPHMVDLEDDAYLPKDIATRVLTFLEAVEARVGMRPIIYTNYAYWKRYFGDLAAFRRHKLCIASYRWDAPLSPLPWGPLRWSFWQFTNRADGRLYGCESRTLDLDVSCGPISAHILHANYE